MSIKKKIVFPPYDLDTALGINNEGELVFGYNLEDTDHQTGGEDVFNGQQSVLWNNIRDAFGDEIAEMYRTLRNDGTLSYEHVEQAFEEHQSKWPENLVNEDADFKYIQPYLEDGTDYLGMLLGLKTEQRKWWLYNRFRYMDSKFNAGDALSDTITIRPYAVSNISITPYADIYTTVNWDGTYDSKRTARGTTSTHLCPYQSMNDNVVIIHSASQLASIGDLSGLKVGLCDISNATRLQSLKVGDESTSYSNPNMRSMTLGNNVLLKVIDARNCVGLGDTTLQGHTQQAVDVSGCTILEEAYFEGTKITSLTLPNGGNLKKLHLPETITNLTVLNQSKITDFQIASYANIGTLRLEGTNLDMLSILRSVYANAPSGTRVRLVGFDWRLTDAAEIESVLAILDTMRGLDANGNNVEVKEAVIGKISTDTLTGAQIASYQAKYPYVEFTADHTSAQLYFYNGSTLISGATQTVLDGGNGTYTGTTPTKAQDAQYTYTFAGWSKGTDDNTVDDDALTHVVGDRNVYACFTGTLRKYNVTFVRASADGGDTLQTIQNVNYGTIVTAASAYTGETPTTTQGDAEDYPFEGWSPASATVQGNTTFTAVFGSPVEVAEITDSWDTIIASIDNGTYKSKYKLGNYKPLDLGTTYGTVNMQIVAIDGDELADGTGTAPLTFLAIELLLQKSKMNSTATNANGYPATDVMKPLLDNTIYPLIPSNISARIQSVSKTYYDYTTQSTLTSAEKLWIPSVREMDELSGAYYEASGVTYYTLFANNASRIKTINNNASTYWLRSANPNSSSKFLSISNSGSYGNDYSNGSYGVCLGFCLGYEPETITDDWSTILANENYATDYSIGDTKYLDLGTEGKQLMKIVAFDTDDRADGTGKAGITWISKYLLDTPQKINGTDKTVDGETGRGIGGWEHCDLRSYLKNTIKPSMPSSVQNGIVSATKVQSVYKGGTKVVDGQTTTDDVWIPSVYEYDPTNTDYETTGVLYSASAPHIKRGTNWVEHWTRSGSSQAGFAYFSTGSSQFASKNASTQLPFALGFCTN